MLSDTGARKKMLQRVRGAGKSILLLQMVEQARTSAWLVVYIPAADMTTPDRKDECQKLLCSLQRDHKEKLRNMLCLVPGHDNVLQLADQFAETNYKGRVIAY